MLVDTTSADAAGAAGAIRTAARRTGASFDYLLATAQIESGLDPGARSRTSSAGGLFQFIDQTWLATLKQAGPSLGYAAQAAAISRTASGRYVVRDPALRADIMQLRQDPTANALMAGAFTNQNAERLTQRLGRAPTEGELYLAHFLGANGAARLIAAAGASPATQAAGMFSRAAAANGTIFYDRSGRARTVAQVYGLLVGKLDTARAKAATAVAAAEPARSAAPLAPAAAAIAAAVTRRQADANGAAASAVATNAFAPTASASAPFLDLFRSEGRGAVSAAVSALWGVPPDAGERTVVVVTPGRAATASEPASPLDLSLFRRASVRT